MRSIPCFPCEFYMGLGLDRLGKRGDAGGSDNRDIAWKGVGKGFRGVEVVFEEIAKGALFFEFDCSVVVGVGRFFGKKTGKIINHFFNNFIDFSCFLM